MSRLFALALLVLFVAPTFAQDEPTSSRAAKRAAAKNAKKDDKPIAPITAEKEAAVNAFVAEHHPELGELLKHLKGMKNQRPYERAIHELFAASERLANLRKNDVRRYDLELNAWKVKSQIQLLSARLTMKDDKQLRNELEAALDKQYDIRREIMVAEKHRIEARLQKLERDLADYDSRRDEAIEKQFKQLTSVPKSRAAAKTDKSKGSKSTTGS